MKSVIIRIDTSVTHSTLLEVVYYLAASFDLVYRPSSSWFTRT